MDAVLANNAPHTQHILWDKTPINIQLPINQEKRISFPGAISLFYPNGPLSSKSVTILNNAGDVYWTAHHAFKPQRVLAKLADGKMILLNLSASNQGNNDSLVILQKSPLSQQPENTKPHSRQALPKVALMRYAIKRLYAPERLWTELPNIHVVPMQTQNTVPLSSQAIIAHPLRSWSDDIHTVTAVLLRNPTQLPIQLKATNLCGHWQAVSFYPRHTLTKANTLTDSTTVFLISQQSFADSLKACLPEASHA